MQQQQQQQSGFTLIELIIVIVILGILAVTAAPKFIDIQGDATASTLQGVKAAVQGGAQLVYAKSAIASEQRTANIGSDPQSQIESGGVTVETHYGYPDAQLTTAASIAGWVDINSSDFLVTPTSGAAATAAVPGDGTFAITPVNGNAPIDFTGADSCHVLYTEPSGQNQPPVVTVVTTGC